MAKLQRKSAKLFAEDATAAAGGIAQFGSLAEGTPNYSTDPDVIQALDAYKEGWSSAVLGTKSPALEDRNALDYLLSYQQAYIMQHGIPEWLDTETYYSGSFASVGSSLFVSKTDNNTGNDPTTDTTETNWAKFPTPLEMKQLVPVGALMMGPVTSMTGYLLCNGQEVSRTTYANLFAVIGTNFGSGNGSTTFNVPDYRGCFLRGLGGDSAADVYTKQNSGVPNVKGTLNPVMGGYNTTPAGTGAFSVSSGGYDTLNGGSAGIYRGNVTLDASLSSGVYQNNLTEARPTNFAVNYFIKY